MPLDSAIGIALVGNSFGLPYFGPLTRHVVVVDEGDTIPTTITWLVTSPGKAPLGCPAAWMPRRIGPLVGASGSEPALTLAAQRQPRLSLRGLRRRFADGAAREPGWREVPHRPARTPSSADLLGAPWYVLNLTETGSLDGGLRDTTGQAADRSVGGALGTLRALAFDIFDTSGLWGSELGVAFGVGAAMVVIGVILAPRGAAAGRALAYGGLLVALVPLLLREAERPVSYAWLHFWFKIGHEGIRSTTAMPGRCWDSRHVALLVRRSGSRLILGGVAAAIVGVRCGLLRRGALVLALAPLGLVVVFAFTIVYDPWRGRLASPVGLACAAWGWTIRVRWLSVGVAGLCITTVVLSLVHSYTRPSGLGLLEPSISRSVWHRDPIDTLTVIRDYDGTPALLRAVEDDVPPDAVLAVAAPIDTFLAPLAGPRLSRTLRLVPHGERVPRDAIWLVSKGRGAASGCMGAWSTVYGNAESHWPSSTARRRMPVEPS